jgi:hypothetical protein
MAATNKFIKGITQKLITIAEKKFTYKRDLRARKKSQQGQWGCHQSIQSISEETERQSFIPQGMLNITKKMFNL